MVAGVSILTDLPYAMSCSQRDEAGAQIQSGGTTVPAPKYTKMGETLRHVIPGHVQCSVACGGKACKYENPTRWSEEDQAIKGLYSSWITDNLLAMARPSTEIIEKYNVLEQFQRFGLKTIINLQRPGEHASCGNPLEQESGFTYRPEMFMEAGIYYYNFGWKDYGVASLTTILDMVKVMSFAVQEGKIAVHCHAGLGRTGVLFACYLVFTTRMNADQAILFVRAKRPKSIQTRGQLLSVREFAQFLAPLRSVFSCVEPKASPVTLSQYLIRQRHLLHGYEARQLKNVPKIVQLVCKRLVDIALNRHEAIKEECVEIPDLTAEVEKTVSQQALQQLGQEMKGKGIPVMLWASPSPDVSALQCRPACDQPLASDNELDPLWRQQNFKQLPGAPALCAARSLSDSALPRLQHLSGTAEINNLANCLIRRSISHDSLSACTTPGCFSLCIQGSARSILNIDIKTSAEEGAGPILKKPFLKQHQDVSSEQSESRWKSLCSPTLLPVSSKNSQVPMEDEQDPSLEKRTDTSDTKDVPFIALQSEFSSENRCLGVARALAMDLTDNELSRKVSVWQTELNSREGTWDRLCTERDPLVLSALMWSWLEQLKDPVITSKDLKTLSEKKGNPLNALDTLEKDRRFTLLCVLNCAAHLLPEPEEVVASFLTQTIKVFTKMDPPSEKNGPLYTRFRAVLTAVLYELHDKAAKASEDHISATT